MGNLATVLTVALVCTALGFVAGSMLTTIWIDRHSKPIRSKNKTSGKDGKEMLRVVLSGDGKTPNLEIDGEIFNSDNRPDVKEMEKLKPIHELLGQWLQPEKKLQEKKEPAKKAENIEKGKASVEEDSGKKEDHDMLFEINEIIQEKLKNSVLADRNVHLSKEGLTGVSFWVGETSYKAIDDIPDVAVTVLIKGAVAQWEENAR